MSAMIDTVRFGTRGSDLALWQTKHVMALLESAQASVQVGYEIIKTRGDQILDTPLPLVGGKGVFTAELESALREKRIDCAVHSLKDLPTEQPDGLVIGAIPPREHPADALISREGYTLETLPQGATVGTSSYRRAAQLLHHRPDLQIRDIRGNVDTRIRKALTPDDGYDAIMLAYAGLARLGYAHVITQVLDFEVMLPAPGQGAIAVQTRDDAALLQTLAPIHDAHAALAVTAERAFLGGLGGGCSVPIAAYAVYQDAQLSLWGRVCSLDGKQQINIRATAEVHSQQAAHELGVALAQEALQQGAKALMEQSV